jgi:hypothetical protein
MPLPEKKAAMANAARARHAAMMKIGFRDGARSFLTGSKSVSAQASPCASVFRNYQAQREKIYDVDLVAVFYFAFANMIKMRTPMFKLLEVFRDPL